VLVPFDRWRTYAQRLIALQVQAHISIVTASAKLFRRPRRSIAFTGEGISFTFDLQNSPAAHAFLQKIDTLDVETGSFANPSKDSRLPARIFAQQQPMLNAFLEQRRAMDPRELFRSALSARLEL
jgi:hypothetical protein